MSDHPSGVHLPNAISHLHMAIAEHADPAAKQELAQALQLLLRRQATDMAPKPGNPVMGALR